MGIQKSLEQDKHFCNTAIIFVYGNTAYVVVVIEEITTSM